jgi:hypothetical protein
MMPFQKDRKRFAIPASANLIAVTWTPWNHTSATACPQPSNRSLNGVPIPGRRYLFHRETEWLLNHFLCQTYFP